MTYIAYQLKLYYFAFFWLTVTDYKYIYFLIRWSKDVTCNTFLPNTDDENVAT